MTSPTAPSVNVNDVVVAELLAEQAHAIYRLIAELGRGQVSPEPGDDVEALTRYANALHNDSVALRVTIPEATAFHWHVRLTAAERRRILDEARAAFEESRRGPRA